MDGTDWIDVEKPSQSVKIEEVCTPSDVKSQDVKIDVVKNDDDPIHEKPNDLPSMLVHLYPQYGNIHSKIVQMCYDSPNKTQLVYNLCQLFKTQTATESMVKCICDIMTLVVPDEHQWVHSDCIDLIEMLRLMEISKSSKCAWAKHMFSCFPCFWK